MWSVRTRTGLQETRPAVELSSAAGTARTGVSQNVPLPEKRAQTTRHAALTPGRPGRQNTVDWGHKQTTLNPTIHLT